MTLTSEAPVTVSARMVTINRIRAQLNASLAFSCYSRNPAHYNAVTMRNSQFATRLIAVEVVSLGIPI
jgi:hypothetical protein